MQKGPWKAWGAHFNRRGRTGDRGTAYNGWVASTDADRNVAADDPVRPNESLKAAEIEQV